MIRRCQPLLGTFVEITLDGGRDAALHREAGQAFELLRGIQQRLSFHDAGSDVSRLNQCAHLTPLRVHPWTWHVLEQALALSAATEGAFDITIAPRLVEWGYLPRHRAAARAAKVGAWRDIELLPDCRVRFHQPLLIDLGGIAKGFAVDKTIDYLASRGIGQATVNAGGDLRMHGPARQPVVIRDPAQPHARQHSTVMLRPAVATSAAYFSRRRVGAHRVSPIVHPPSGQPLRSNASVSVFAPTCLEADALTKAVLLAPPAIWRALLQARDSVALFLSAQGEPVLSPA